MSNDPSKHDKAVTAIWWLLRLFGYFYINQQIEDVIVYTTTLYNKTVSKY